MFSLPLRLGAVMVTVATALAVGGVVVAAVPDHDGVVNTCVRDNGTMRVIDPSTEGCLSNETAVQMYSTDGADVAFLDAHAAAGGDLTGQYPNPSIAPDAVTGAKVQDDSLTGDDIVESGLAQVPSAAAADTAARASDADQLDGADASDLVLHCPSGTTRASDMCVDAEQQAATAWTQAYGACLNRGMRLPSIPELSASFPAFTLPAGDETNWTDDHISATEAVAVRLTGFTVAFQHPNKFAAIGYRCVTSPTNDFGSVAGLRAQNQTPEFTVR